MTGSRRRRPDPRRAKTHYSYTVAEVAALFAIHRNTVRNWIANGLETVKVGRTVLILGDELRRFLTKRRAQRRQKCPPGTMYCFKCRDARRPPEGLVEAGRVTATTVNLRGLCSHCGSWMYRRANIGRLHEIGFGDLRATLELPHLADSSAPSLNCDSLTDA